MDTTSGAAALDARFFPHILDMIIRYAPYEVLLCMRATSRDVKTRVDAAMLDCAALRPADHRRYYWSDSDDERAAHPLCIANVVVTKKEGRRIPALYGTNKPLRQIRVLDTEGLCRVYNARDPDDLGGSVDPVDLGLQPMWIRTRGNRKFGLAGLEAPVHVFFPHSPGLPLLRGHETAWPMCAEYPSAFKVVINLEHDCGGLAQDGVASYLEIWGIASARAGSDVEALVFVSHPIADGTKRCVEECHLTTGIKMKGELGSESTGGFESESSLANVVGRIAAHYWKSSSVNIILVGFSLECIAPPLFASERRRRAEEAERERDAALVRERGEALAALAATDAPATPLAQRLSAVRRVNAAFEGVDVADIGNVILEPSSFDEQGGGAAAARLAVTVAANGGTSTSLNSIVNGSSGTRGTPETPTKDDALEWFNAELLRLYTHLRDTYPTGAHPADFPAPEEIEEFIEQTQIVDHETYRSWVGDEAYRIETVW